MPRENVELARRGYERFNETGQFPLEFISPECEFDFTEAMPDVSVFTGLDEANAVLRDWASAFEDFHIEPDEFREVGTDRVVAFVRNVGTLAGERIENRFVHVWTVQDGKAIRMEGYLDEAKALEAAGLSE